MSEPAQKSQNSVVPKQNNTYNKYMPTNSKSSDGFGAIEPPKVAALSWPSGKDSALALRRLTASKQVEIRALLTTTTEGIGRVSMHGIREELVDLQAEAIGIKLIKVSMPFPCPDSIYEERIQKALRQFKAEGGQALVFGDVLLADLKKYREERLTAGILEPLFPLWQNDTRKLVREIISSGIKARIVCVDTKKIPMHFLGKDLTTRLLDQLPSSVDPCGENGEFHTFVYDSPNFKQPISTESGEIVTKQGFAFLDLRPAHLPITAHTHSNPKQKGG